MTEPPGDASARTLRRLLWGLLAGQIAAASIAVVLTSTGRAPLLGRQAERVVVYAWVAVTIVAAVAAYVLGRGGDRGRQLGFGRAIASAGLADLAAFAGILAFYAVRAWPMLPVALLAALLGIALAYPRRASDARLAAADETLPPGDARLFR